MVWVLVIVTLIGDFLDLLLAWFVCYSAFWLGLVFGLRFWVGMWVIWFGFSALIVVVLDLCVWGGWWIDLLVVLRCGVVVIGFGALLCVFVVCLPEWSVGCYCLPGWFGFGLSFVLLWCFGL